MSVRIGLGISQFPSDPAALWNWVDRLEQSSVDSIWQSDRLVSPQPSLEAMSLMAALAGRTERLKFGMSVVVISHRDPLVLARQCATIDFLSGGRLLPAFGVGSEFAPEWKATGVSPRGRGARADEALEILSRLWSEERVSFEGRYYRYRDVSIAPRPIQQPLPLWIGGSSPAAIRRTARIGTGWIAGIQSPDQVAPVVAGIKRALRESGRSIDPDHYGAGFSFRFGDRSDEIVSRTAKLLGRLSPGLDPERYLAVGGAAEVLERIREYRAAGISKFVLRPLATDAADLEAQTERLIEQVLPAAHALADPAAVEDRAVGT